MAVLEENFSDPAAVSSGQLADSVFSQLAGVSSAPMTRKVGLCVMLSAPHTLSREGSANWEQ